MYLFSPHPVPKTYDNEAAEVNNPHRCPPPQNTHQNVPF